MTTLQELVSCVPVAGPTQFLTELGGTGHGDALFRRCVADPARSSYVAGQNGGAATASLHGPAYLPRWVIA